MHLPLGSAVALHRGLATPLKTNRCAGSAGGTTATVPLSLPQLSTSPNTLYATGSISHQSSRWGEAFAASARDLPTGSTSPKAWDHKRGPGQLAAGQGATAPQLSEQAHAVLGWIKENGFS